MKAITLDMAMSQVIDENRNSTGDAGAEIKSKIEDGLQKLINNGSSDENISLALDVISKL